MLILDAVNRNDIVIDSLANGQPHGTCIWTPRGLGGPRKRTSSCVTTSPETVSRVTKTASFLSVPASRSEWASTRAPKKRRVSSKPEWILQLAL
jgi:hypothetical protein